MSLGIREAAVTGPLHNWFGDRVSRRLLCPVSYVSRYLSMCFPLSYHCHSILYHIVHKLPSVIWVTLSVYDLDRDCVLSTLISIVIYHMSHYLFDMFWFPISMQHCSYLCLPGYPCFPSTSKFQLKSAKETIVVPNLPFGIRGPAFVRDCSQKGTLKWHNGKTKLWNIGPNN